MQMRIYIVILSDIKTQECDINFAKKIEELNFEWWRYTALNWIIATPVTIATNEIISYGVEAYGAEFSTVLEVSINDVGGIFPTNKKNIDANTTNPFEWFYKIKDPNFKPKWIKK